MNGRSRLRTTVTDRRRTVKTARLKTTRLNATRPPRRRRSGASLVETMVGFIIIIPIGLAAIDIVILLSTSQSNEQWAEMASKTAARRGNEQAALKAAQNAIEQCPTDNVVLSIQVADVNFDIAHGQVTVDTVMDVKLPIPVPFMPPQVQFRANSTQPIVSTRAPI